MSLAIARVPLLMIRGDTLVLVDDDWRTASGPWLMCLVCGDPLEVGASYAFAEWGTRPGIGRQLLRRAGMRQRVSGAVNHRRAAGFPVDVRGTWNVALALAWAAA